VLIELHPVPCASKQPCHAALRRSSGSRRRSSPLNTLASCRRYLMRSNSAMPSSPHATASPSRMQQRERAAAQHASRRIRCSSALLDGPPASRNHQRMDPTVRELVLIALLSAFLCVVALIYADPIATTVFAALTSGCVVIAAGLSRGTWT
jgi:hypothetical protein